VDFLCGVFCQNLFVFLHLKIKTAQHYEIQTPYQRAI
jgi:hypothetical protein